MSVANGSFRLLTLRLQTISLDVFGSGIKTTSEYSRLTSILGVLLTLCGHWLLHRMFKKRQELAQPLPYFSSPRSSLNVYWERILPRLPRDHTSGKGASEYPMLSCSALSWKTWSLPVPLQHHSGGPGGMDLLKRKSHSCSTLDWIFDWDMDKMLVPDERRF
jgi:hypothetical protein